MGRVGRVQIKNNSRWFECSSITKKKGFIKMKKNHNAAHQRHADSIILQTETTTSQYVFEISGEFANIDDKLSPLYDASGNIYGFTLPDGRACDLAICLRCEDKKGDEKWIVSEEEMAELGLDGLIYDRAEFSVNDEYDNGK